MNRGRGARLPSAHTVFFSPQLHTWKGHCLPDRQERPVEGRGGGAERGAWEEGTREGTKIVHLSRNNLH